jgi:hypothetical protein
MSEAKKVLFQAIRMSIEAIEAARVPIEAVRLF